MKRHPLLVLCVAALAACASAPPPPPVAPALRAALDSGSSAPRLYHPDEVKWPVVTAPNTEMPNMQGAPDGTATIRFVVDSAGHVEPGTTEYVQGNRELAALLSDALKRWHFYPAKLSNGQHVRQLTELSAVKHGSGTIIRLSTDPK